MRGCLLVLALSVMAADWPQFLGPERNGISAESGLNLDWKQRAPRVLWKVPLGSGYSSIAIVGERGFTMAARGGRDLVICLDLQTGKELWTHDGGPTYIDVQKQGAGPRATPTFHRGRLYCLMPQGELICLEAASGERHWHVNTFEAARAKDPVGEFYYWGVSLSPLVEGDLVIVQPGGKEMGSVAAFHKDTGKLAWSAGEDPLGYASPIAVTIDGQRQIVCPTGQSILGLEPKTGRVLWRYGFGNRFNATAATPVWAEGLLFVSAAYGTGAAALEIVRTGDQWEAREKWRKRELQNLMATSIVRDGHIYGCNGDLAAITIRCLELSSGELKWQERQPGRCSFIAVAGHMISLGERGTVQLLAASPSGLSVKGELPDLLTFKAWAMPALANGRLYVRDEKHLVCVDLR